MGTCCCGIAVRGAVADGLDHTSHFARGDALRGRADDVSRREGAGDRRIGDAGWRTGRPGDSGGAAQEHHDAAGNLRLSEMNVRLRHGPPQARESECIRDGRRIAAAIDLHIQRRRRVRADRWRLVYAEEPCPEGAVVVFAKVLAGKPTRMAAKATRGTNMSVCRKGDMDNTCLSPSTHVPFAHSARQDERPGKRCAFVVHCQIKRIRLCSRRVAGVPEA